MIILSIRFSYAHFKCKKMEGSWQVRTQVRCDQIQKPIPTPLFSSHRRPRPSEHFTGSTALGRIQLCSKSRLFLSNLHSSQNISLPMNFNVDLNIFTNKKKNSNYRYMKAKLTHSHAQNNQCKYAGIYIHSFHTKPYEHSSFFIISIKIETKRTLMPNKSSHEYLYKNYKVLRNNIQQ